MSEEAKSLSRSEQAFINKYLECFNATAAYLLIHPRSKYDSARANSARLIAKDNVKGEIRARLDEAQMTADEALKRLAAMARADIGEFITPLGGLDLEAAKEAGLTPLIKKIKQRTITKIGKGDKDDDTEIHDLEIELHDAQAAIDKILKVHGRYTERVDLTNSDGKLQPVIIKVGINPDEL